MNPSVIVPNRHTRRRQTALRQLAALGPFIEGSLSPFQRAGCSQPGWRLTFKQRGRTRTLYVPMELSGGRWTLLLPGRGQDLPPLRFEIRADH